MFDVIGPPLIDSVPVLYVIDNSENMAGKRIATVNEYMRQTIELLKLARLLFGSPEVLVGILKSSPEPSWIPNYPKYPNYIDLAPVKDVCWTDLEADGPLNMQRTFRRLEKMLMKPFYADCKYHCRNPIIFFIIGTPAPYDFGYKLHGLGERDVFRDAMKVVLTVGEDADAYALASFTGDPDWVIPIDAFDTASLFVDKIFGYDTLGPADFILESKKGSDDS